MLAVIKIVHPISKFRLSVCLHGMNSISYFVLKKEIIAFVLNVLPRQLNWALWFFTTGCAREVL